MAELLALARRVRGKTRRAAFPLLCAVLLSACAPLLERQYVSVEPHSSKFWESEAAGTLRAENHQDIVNDLLVLIERHTESATLRLYHFGDEQTVAGTLESAAVETQKETPLGAYAVSYITSTSQAQRGYYEVKLQIGYRRSAEELAAIVNATSAEALYSLLREAVEQGRESLAVRIGYWGPDSPRQVEEAITRLQEETEKEREAEEVPSEDETDSPERTEPSEAMDPPEKTEPSETTEPPERTESPGEQTEPIQVYYYPENGPVGLIEFLLSPQDPVPVISPPLPPA